MSQVYGSEAPRAHRQAEHQPPARFLVLIESGGVAVARLFLESRQQVADFDAGTGETAQMIAGLVAQQGADGAEWDRALEGHSLAERRAAQVFVLPA